MPIFGNARRGSYDVAESSVQQIRHSYKLSITLQINVQVTERPSFIMRRP